MSIKIMSRVFDTTFRSLSFDDNGVETTLSPSTVKIVLLAIADSSDDEGDNSYNGVKRLVTKTNLSERSVVRAIKALVDAGYLQKHDERSRLGTNSYQINLSMLEGEQKQTRSRMGRPTQEKVSDSTPKVSDSTPKVSDSTHPDPSLSIHNHPMPPQKTLQTEPSSHAKKGEPMNADEYKKRLEPSVFAYAQSMQKGDYAQYPEDVRPVLDRLDRLWFLHPPAVSKKKGGRYAFWVETSRELLEACGEFGVELLDKLRVDWDKYNQQNGGLAPHTVSSPKSLVNTCASKAALLRQGIEASMWEKASARPAVRQSRLDV